MNEQERVELAQQEIDAIVRRYGITLMVVNMLRDVIHGQSVFTPQIGIVPLQNWTPPPPENTEGNRAK